jgi:hypothetical protein
MGQRAGSSRSNTTSSRLSNDATASASATREQRTLRRKPKDLGDPDSDEQDEETNGVKDAATTQQVG